MSNFLHDVPIFRSPYYQRRDLYIAMACTLTLAAENIKSTFIYLGCKWNRNGKSYSDGNFDALSAFIKSLISKTFVVFSGADEEVKRQSLADEY